LVEIEYTDEFRKSVSKMRDEKVRERIIKLIEKIKNNPDIGKPLSYDLTGIRSLRIPPFRILYELKGEKIILRTFEHRDKVY